MNARSESRDSEGAVLDRVVVTNPFVGLLHMQVCAARDATDEEILRVCNTQNPCGTSEGWSYVIREPDGSRFQPSNTAPVVCSDDAERVHFLVGC